MSYSYQIATLFNTTPLILTYDFQFIRADLLGDRFIPRELVNGIQYYSFVNKMDPVAIALENNLCIGIELRITDSLVFSQKLGSGIASFHGLDKTVLATAPGTSDFSYFIKFGLILELNVN